MIALWYLVEDLVRVATECSFSRNRNGYRRRGRRGPQRGQGMDEIDACEKVSQRITE